MLPRGILRIPCRSSAAAHGTSTCDEYSAAWSLEVGEGWITRRLDVAVRSAHVDTLGPQAVDVFYLQEASAGALSETRAAEAAHAVRAALTRGRAT